ncbi:hydrogen peroxide-inducible genes activator [Allohahella marinimesophila]|uniref:Oxidative stress transcriptional regulator OxyR n=1 Tax=Allohahella marinimesophila TaxID=1054972 RepID=A0ABP7P9X0_9GAMM
MTLTELRYIVTLAEERHFGRAAERCHVSQPTLSVAVKKLEDELAITLFERSKSSIAITDIGIRIIEQSRHVLDEIGVLKNIAQSGKDQLGSSLRLGAILTVGPYLFPHLTPQVRQAAPNMPLYIEENYTSALRERLRHNELDAIIVALPFSEPEVLTKPLYDEPFVVLMPADHPLTKFKAIPTDALPVDELLLLGPGHCFRDQVIESCPQLTERLRDLDRGQSMSQQRSGQRGDPRQVQSGNGRLMTEGTSLETIRHMVASGLGITVLPASAALTDRYSPGVLTVRPFEAPSPFRTVGLAWRVSFPRPKAIDVLTRAAGQCRILD